MQDNYFYKKYEPINWKEDGTQIFNKIGNNLTSRFETMNFEIIDDVDGFRMIVRQGESFCELWWVYYDEDGYAQLENSNSEVLRNMDDVEGEIEECGLVRESKISKSNMKNLKTFENWVSDMEMEESEMRLGNEEGCDCEEGQECNCGPECKCGPDCKCQECQDKYGE
jgi:hypothetical protein